MEVLNTTRPIPVKCNHCQQDYSSTTIITHHKKHHNELNLNYSPSQVSCSKCHQTVSVSQLTNHNLICERRVRKLVLGTIMEEETGTKAICKYCKRKFALHRIIKHEVACEFSSKKRPIFDISRKRSPLYNENVKIPVKHEKLSLNYPNSKWQKQHLDLIKNLKCEGDDSYLTEYVNCNFCYRKFAPTIIEKHSEICKKIVNKPNGPVNNPNFPAVLKVVKAQKVKSERTLCRSTSVYSSQALCQKTLPLQERAENAESLNCSFMRLPKVQKLEKFKETKIPTVSCPCCGKFFTVSAAKSHIHTCKQHSLQSSGTFSFLNPSKLPNFSHRSKSSTKLRDLQDCANCSAPFAPLANYCMMCGKSK